MPHDALGPAPHSKMWMSVVVPVLLASISGFATASWRSTDMALRSENRVTALEVRLDETKYALNQKILDSERMVSAFKEWYRETTKEDLSRIDKRLEKIETRLYRDGARVP